ncbi:hypothetical protein [Brevundimonas sp.]|uniref:hypothetical protein n=1 Tax=Brevundimonas sp. TaxID=1871086 RepID=UPI0035B4AD58
MSDEALEKADQEATAISERIDALKLEIVAAGYALAKTGGDHELRKVAHLRETLELLEFALKQRPAAYGYIKSLMG